MKEGEDFKFRDDLQENEKDTVPLEITFGPYSGTIFRYTVVQLQEEPENFTGARLKFQYEILDAGKHTETKLRSDERFSSHIGILLNTLLLESLDHTLENLDTEDGVDIVEVEDKQS